MPEVSGVGVITTDRHLVVRTWNPWLSAATGLPDDRACGRPIEELTEGPTSDWYREIFSDVIATGTPRVLAPAFHRFLVSCPPRTPSPHFDRMQQRVTVAPLRDGDDIVGLILTIEDVTARLDAERQLAAEFQRGDGRASALAAVGADDWRVRRDAVQALRQSASTADIEHLIQSLQRDHQNLAVLNSALQVLTASDLDIVPPLLELLRHEDANVRMHAALAVGELRSEAALGALLAALDDSDANVRFHAIEALGRLGAPEAVEPLASIAASGDFFLAFAAIEALAKTDDSRVTATLAGMLDQDALRPAIIDTLSVLGDEDSVPALVDLVNAGEGDAAAVAAALERIHARYEDTYAAGAHIADLVRARVTPAGISVLRSALERRAAPLRPLVAVLGWTGREAVDALLDILGEPGVQASVDGALMRFGADVVEPLMPRLETGTRQEQLAAASLLGRLGDRRAVPALIGLLRRADADLVATTAAALASLGDPRALDDLLPLFAHESGAVRQAAVAAVNAIAAPATASKVQSRLADPDPRVRECAIRVGGYFGFDQCVPGILAATDDPHDDVRRAAIEQLPVLDDARAVPRLLDALGREVPRNRAAAAHALRAVDDPAAGWPLQRALEDADPWVRYFAAGSIARHRSIDAVPALVEMARSDEAPHVRIAALHALGTLDVPEVVDVAAGQIQSADPDLAAAAVSALAGASDARVDHLLEEAARSPNVACRIPAVRALSSRPTRAAALALAWAARLDAPPELKGLALEALAGVAASESPDVSATAVRELLELAAGDAARDAALAALSMLRPTAAVPLAEALNAARLEVRLVAVEALGRMRHPAASELLARALDDEAPSVRSAAVAVFARLGTTGVRDVMTRMQTSDPDAGVRRRAAALCRRHGWVSGA